MKLENEDYIVIPAFVVMSEEDGGLGLKGNEATVFSVIYGFSKDGESWFQGSQSYLAAWCGCTKQGIQKNINSLLNKNLIKREYVTKNGVRYANYRSCHPTNLVGGGDQQSLHHNIEHNNTPSDIDSNESISSPPKGKRQKQEGFVKPQIEDVVAYCIEHEFICDPYQFYDHFEANGWLVSGRAKMKDWVAALRNWERNERKRDPRFKT